jgi:NAD-dependent SIR2 family protein deacetylase
MYHLIASLDDEDCVVVIGTSGQVVPFHAILHGVLGYKVLCNLDPLHSVDWDDDLFGSTRIDTRKGERWFCTEREARDNGWKHAWE